MLVGIGGVVLAVSPYFQWVSVIGLININLSQLLILAGYKGDLAYIVSVAGGIVALIAFADYYDGKSSRPLGLCAGIIVGVTGVPETLHLIHVVNASQGAVSFGPGIIIAGLGEAHVLQRCDCCDQEIICGYRYCGERRQRHKVLSVVRGDDQATSDRLSLLWSRRRPFRSTGLPWLTR
jgi:hypothetical protein